jgi:hypothetical protein
VTSDTQNTMNKAEFREMALGFPGAVANEHMSHPDFRINGKIFATLGYPDEGWGMVKLTPGQQQVFVGKFPDAFGACRGTWGKKGATNVHLGTVKKSDLAAALAAAFENVSAGRRKREA